jgi:GNAT superfamily N-acetyltransferase
MKVVDAANGNGIISIARWHFYPRGYSFEEEIHWETHNAPDAGTVGSAAEDEGQIPKDFNILLHNHILRTRDLARSSWIPANKPCWILMHMVTHPAHRGKGAAGMLIRWGIEQAERTGAGVPAYLEAGVMGRPIYERFGFVQVGELLEVDLEGCGGKGKFVMCTMAHFPGDGRGSGWEGERKVVSM